MDLNERIERIFQTVRRGEARLPSAESMSEKLELLVPRGNTGTVIADKKVLALFATSSVEMWERGVHSLLISASLTGASPMWASICGYYASHYAVRSLAHLLGFCLLFRRKLVVHLEPTSAGFGCTFDRAGDDRREHTFYWKRVKAAPEFVADPLYTNNPDSKDVSDCAHRNFANYSGHLSNYPGFSPLDIQTLRDRMQQISTMQLYAPPIPDRTKYPDLDTVQLAAYHRLIHVREIVDNALGGKNRYWAVHRSPHWVGTIISYSRTIPNFLPMSQS